MRTPYSTVKQKNRFSDLFKKERREEESVDPEVKENKKQETNIKYVAIPVLRVNMLTDEQWNRMANEQEVRKCIDK